MHLTILTAVLLAAPPPAPATPPALFVPPRPEELVPLDQPVYGNMIEVVPALRVAMVEANRPLYASDPLVARAAGTLSQLTAVYVEDAARIVELTLRATEAARASKRPASPFAIMEGALRLKRPPGLVGNVPREYEAVIAPLLPPRVKGNAAPRDGAPPAPAPGRG